MKQKRFNESEKGKSDCFGVNISGGESENVLHLDIFVFAQNNK